MSDYKPKIKISEALSIMDSMLTVRRKDTRVKSADAIETVLYDYYRKSEKLDKIEQILKKASYVEDNKVYSYLYNEDKKLEHIGEILDHE